MNWNFMYDFWCYGDVSTDLSDLLDTALRWNCEPQELLRLDFVPTGGDYSWSSFRVA